MRVQKHAVIHSARTYARIYTCEQLARRIVRMTACHRDLDRPQGTRSCHARLSTWDTDREGSSAAALESDSRNASSARHTVRQTAMQTPVETRQCNRQAALARHTCGHTRRPFWFVPMS